MFSSLRTATLALILAVAAIAIIGLPAQADDPSAGIWELNLAKSRFTNVPPPKSQTRAYEVLGQSVKMTEVGIDAEWKPSVMHFTAKLDGKDYPYTGAPICDMISLTPVDALTANFTIKKAGKVVGSGTRVISNDLKMMTISFKGTDAKGKPVESIRVFDRR
jgi:hypothetical protein